MSDTMATVRADADLACSICKGLGWHWGWTSRIVAAVVTKPLDPVRLRCPCVDIVRAARQARKGAAA